MSDLYAEVRADDDPERGHATWRAGRDDLFRTHPQSPLPARDPLRETGLPYWPYDPAWRLSAPIRPAEPDDRPGGGAGPGAAERTDVDGGDDGNVTMVRIGALEVPDVGSLDVWRLHQYAGGLFVPIKDGTSGQESYGAGRYLLDTAKAAWLGTDGDDLVLDLNFTYHPSCRYDDQWRCPLAPPGNTVGVRVEAGERLSA